MDVIHTNDGKLILGSLGYKENLGHADVYPNGGSAQPGCSLVSRTIYDFLRKRFFFITRVTYVSGLMHWLIELMIWRVQCRAVTTERFAIISNPSQIQWRFQQFHARVINFIVSEDVPGTNAL